MFLHIFGGMGEGKGRGGGGGQRRPYIFQELRKWEIILYELGFLYNAPKPLSFFMKYGIDGIWVFNKVPTEVLDNLTKPKSYVIPLCNIYFGF